MHPPACPLASSCPHQVSCGNQFELLGQQIYLAVSNKCPDGAAGAARPTDPSSVSGITLHTSDDGGTTFKAACLPVALKVWSALSSAPDNTGFVD